ncbi:ATP-dependent zinc protease family protein [Sulfurimonas sp.]|uniref:ATP-dependent zinc protease family protein n=1 Tax=Sulfurimonas sp. TaxID=2022749 RepID=UPI003D115B9E
MYKRFVLFTSLLFFVGCSAMETEAPQEIQPKKAVVKKAPKKVQKIPTKQDNKLIVGGLEYVYIPSSNVTLKARIDTGAKTSSVYAVDVKEFERDGKRWVKFKLISGKNSFVEKALPVVRTVRIKQEAELDNQRRYVVKMRINLGTLSQLVEVTLNDRSKLLYPVLIGRNYLTGFAMVDVSKKYLTTPQKK